MKEVKFGLASMFHVKYLCGETNIFSTGKMNNEEKNGQGPFHINTKFGVVRLTTGNIFCPP